MLRKWYIELPLVLLAIAIAVILVLNLDFTAAISHSSSSTEQTDSLKSPAPITDKKWLDGKSLFRSNCASCHNPKAEGVGPPLIGITERWNEAGSYNGKSGEEWLVLWIRNWHTVVDAGYPYGVKMANSRKDQMNIFQYLSNEDIDKILLYVNTPQGTSPVVALP